MLGPNGAGKTTTVRLLNGVLAPDRGSSRVLGIDPAADGDEVRRRTGVLTENAGLDDRLTARENLVFTARIRGMNTTDAGDRRRPTMLERFGMVDRADDQVQGFSTGQRKRVALGTGAAARSRRAVPRRADVGPRSRCHTRRHRPHRHPRGRARPHRRALHPLPRRGRTAGAPHGGAATAATCSRSAHPTSSPARSGRASMPTSISGAPADDALARDARRCARRAHRAIDGERRGRDGERPRGRSPGSSPRSRRARCPSTARCRCLRRSRTCTSRSVHDQARQGGAMNTQLDTNAIRAVMGKDLTAVRRSKAVVLPMLLVPLLLFVLLPACSRVRGTLACTTSTSTRSSVGLPGDIAKPIRRLPDREQLVVLVNGYLLAPLFLIVPLMVSVVLAADAFAGEKERKTHRRRCCTSRSATATSSSPSCSARSCPRSSCHGSGSSASRWSRTRSRGR